MSDAGIIMGDAGKAMLIPRGQYSDTETYEYLDFVYSSDASYVAKKLTTGNPPAEDNEYWQLLARGGALTENSDVSNTTVKFEKAGSRINIFSKDSLSVIAGKVSKWFADLKTVAFSGKYEDLEGRVTVTNNDLANVPGTAWDAVRGAAIRQDVDKLNSDLDIFSMAKLQNGDCDVNGYNNAGVCYRCANFAIIKAYFSGLHFVSGDTMFIVPEGYRPSKGVPILISCIRLSGGRETNTTLGVVKTDGSIIQSFNSEGNSTIWEGEIFAMYKL